MYSRSSRSLRFSTPCSTSHLVPVAARSASATFLAWVASAFHAGPFTPRTVGQRIDARFHVVVPFVSCRLAANESLQPGKAAIDFPPRDETHREMHYCCRRPGCLGAILSVS